MPTPGEVLVQGLRRLDRWPPPRELHVRKALRLWRAFMESDKEVLADASGLDSAKYMVDPLGPKIAEAYSDLVWQDEPIVEAASDSDQQEYDDIVEANGLGGKVKLAVEQQVGEGSTWWRIHSDPDLADQPLVEYHSRDTLIPLYVAGTLRAVGFFTAYPVGRSGDRIYRHFEVHEPGRVINVLFKGSASHLGNLRPLTEFEETQFLRDEWQHDLPMLAGALFNKIRPISEFDGIEDMLLELNESLATGKSNRRLVARRRVVAPASALDEHNQLDPEQEVLIDEPSDTGDTANPGASRFKVLEYSFDAQALITYQNDLAVKALSRVGIAAQLLGVPTADGFAQTGTALRLRLIPSINAANGKGKPWDDQLPTIVWLLARVAALSVDMGGFGVTLAKPDDTPAVTRKHAIPEDPVERVARVAQAVVARTMSRRQAIKEQHPDWDDSQVDEELSLIDDDIKIEAPTAPAGGSGGGSRNLFNNGNLPTDRAAQGAASAADGATAQS